MWAMTRTIYVFIVLLLCFNCYIVIYIVYIDLMIRIDHTQYSVKVDVVILSPAPASRYVWHSSNTVRCITSHTNERITYPPREFAYNTLMYRSRFAIYSPLIRNLHVYTHYSKSQAWVRIYSPWLLQSVNDATAARLSSPGNWPVSPIS